MRPTYTFLRQSFIRFNKEMFGAQLPDVPLRIGRGRKIVGCMHYRSRRNPDGSESYCDFSISVSAAYEREKAELEDILIHEMIHLYEFAVLGGPETTAHGPFFRREMERINRGHGRHITVRDHLDDETRKTDSRVESNIIGIIHFKDGRKGLTRVAKSCIFKLYDSWRRAMDVERVDWYFTLMPEVKKYNRVQTMRYYYPGDGEIEAIINHPATAGLEMVTKGGRRYAQPILSH